MKDIRCILIILLLTLFILIGGFIIRLEFLSYQNIIINNIDKNQEEVISEIHDIKDTLEKWEAVEE